MQINRFAMTKPVFRQMVLDHVSAQLRNWTSVQARDVPKPKVKAELEKLLDILTKAVTEDTSWEYTHLKEALMYTISELSAIEPDAVSAAT